MVAYYQVERNAGEELRILRIDNVKNEAEARGKLLERLKNFDVNWAKLIGLEEEALHYTFHEIMTERNILGGPRRYSTGTQTVTIPE